MILAADHIRWYRNKDSILLDGAFDPLHAGHLAYFRRASAMFPSHLKIVGVASDGDIRAKGREPLFDQQTRCQLVSALKDVDLVFPKEESTESLIAMLRPSYYVKGIDWSGKLPASQERACSRYGIPIIYLETKRASSSEALRQWALRDAERGLDRLEDFCSKQTPASVPWQPVTDYSFEARKAIEGPHAELIRDAFSGCSVLDVGCGPDGHLVRLLREIGVEAYGFDVHPPRGEWCWIDDLCDQDHEERRTPLGSYELVINRECLEHLTVRQISIAVRNLFRLSSKFVYITTRFTDRGVFDAATDFETDPTHITCLSQPFLRALCVLNGGKRRRDLEAKLDWQQKGRVLVYEVA